MNEFQQSEIYQSLSKLKCICGFPYNPSQKQLEHLLTEKTIEMRCCCWNCGYLTTITLLDKVLEITSSRVRPELLTLQS